MVHIECTGLSWFVEQGKLHPTTVGKFKLEITLVAKLAVKQSNLFYRWLATQK
jgi:hypothetical protein